MNVYYILDKKAIAETQEHMHDNNGKPIKYERINSNRVPIYNVCKYTYEGPHTAHNITDDDDDDNNAVPLQI